MTLLSESSGEGDEEATENYISTLWRVMHHRVAMWTPDAFSNSTTIMALLLPTASVTPAAWRCTTHPNLQFYVSLTPCMLGLLAV